MAETMSNDDRFTWGKGDMNLVDQRAADEKYLMHLVRGTQVEAEVAEWLKGNPPGEEVRHVVAELEKRSNPPAPDGGTPDSAHAGAPPPRPDPGGRPA